MIDFKRVFLDTSPVIYYLQQDTVYFQKTKDILLSLSLSGAEFVSSDITIAEYSVFPFRTKNHALLTVLTDFINESQVKIIHTSNNIALNAARIRAEYKGFKAMDSLQIATAIESGCDLFMTNDKQLRQFDGITCVTVDDMAEMIRGIE